MLNNISWKRYLAIDRAFGDDNRPGTLLNYCDGQLEIMTTSADHERIKIIIRRCIECYCDEKDIYFSGQGAMTRRSDTSERGAEADESYSFDQETGRLQLVVEVALTSGGIDKLRLYQKLDNPEVWIWRRGRLQVHAWDDGAYHLVSQSTVLPALNLAWIQELASWRDDYEAVREFRRRLRLGKKK